MRSQLNQDIVFTKIGKPYLYDLLGQTQLKCGSTVVFGLVVKTARDMGGAYDVKLLQLSSRHQSKSAEITT